MHASCAGTDVSLVWGFTLPLPSDPLSATGLFFGLDDFTSQLSSMQLDADISGQYVEMQGRPAASILPRVITPLRAVASQSCASLPNRHRKQTSNVRASPSAMRAQASGTPDCRQDAPAVGDYSNHLSAQAYMCASVDHVRAGVQPQPARDASTPTFVQHGEQHDSKLPPQLSQQVQPSGHPAFACWGCVNKPAGSTWQYSRHASSSNRRHHQQCQSSSCQQLPRTGQQAQHAGRGKAEA